MTSKYPGCATFSDCGTYRYELGRDLRAHSVGDLPLFGLRSMDGEMDELALGRLLLFIMLNPSKATAVDDDNTIRRCIGYALAWEYQQLLIGNAYAYRATDPADMFAAQARGVDIVGPKNDYYLTSMVERAVRSGGEIVVAWGGDCDPERARKIYKLVADVGGSAKCLKTNKDGSPVHPLYQPKHLRPIPWTAMEPV